jgi:hypothetical protein
MRRNLIIGFAAAMALNAGEARPQGPDAVGPVLVANSTLRAALERIERKSALWRAAMDSIATLGRHVLVVTPDMVVAESDGSDHAALDAGSLAAAAPVLLADSTISAVTVVVNVELLRRAHRTAGGGVNDFEQDLERILVHEVYGHAVPYLLAGGMSGRCADPVPGERARDACSIRRENAVRAEARLGRRVTYGLDGLAIGWSAPVEQMRR